MVPKTARHSQPYAHSMGKSAAAAFLLVGAMSLGACSSGPDVEGTEPGDWVVEKDGATAIIDVDVAPEDDPELAEIEAFRVAKEAEPVTYFAIEVDNTDSEEDFGFAELALVTEDGQQLVADVIWSVLGDWDYIDSPGPSSTELYNAHLGREDVLAGAKSTFFAAAPGDIGSLERVLYITSLLEPEIEAELVE